MLRPDRPSQKTKNVGPILYEKTEKRKERKDDLYSAFILRIISALSHGSHSITCKYTMRAFPSSHSLDVAASTKYSSRHPVAAYYSFIDPERMKGWAGLVGWPVAGGLPTLVVIHQLQVERRTGKVRRPKTDALTTEPRHHAITASHIFTFQYNKFKLANFITIQ